MSPTIRLLKSDELPKLLPLGKPFWDEIGYGGEFNPEHFSKVWEAGIATGTFFCVVSEVEDKIVAAFGGIIFPDINTGDVVASETFYYAFPEYRGAALRLFPAFEEEAKRRGAKRVWMIHLEHLNAERMERWYQRRGYKLRERLYMKEL